MKAHKEYPLISLALLSFICFVYYYLVMLLDIFIGTYRISIVCKDMLLYGVHSLRKVGGFNKALHFIILDILCLLVILFFHEIYKLERRSPYEASKGIHVTLRGDQNDGFPKWNPCHPKR